MNDRPSPEEMLARAAEEEARASRGKLKVFFGAAPGVGKTYAMLEEGRRQQAAGIVVVLGWVETHGRPETEALTGGLERIPPRGIEHKGVQLEEFDLDAALRRHPQLLLVDELPHTNAPGSRHARRWQDVEELLAAGIDVYTTLNVQHLESLNDVVAQVTGVRVRETVPDALIDRADVVELVDLPPEDLIRRLEEGKVYLGDAAARALDGYFRRGNLIALRELSLRRTAERVDAEALAWRRNEGIDATWPVGERVMVAVGPAPQAADLVRAAARIAGRLHAPWLAVSVEVPSQSDAARTRIGAHLTLAERLGGEPVVLRGDRPVDEILALARKRNVTRILVGRPTHPPWRDRLYGSFIDTLTRGALGIDIIVTAGDVAPEAVPERPPTPWPSVPEVAQALAAVAVATALGFAFSSILTLADQAMLELLAVVIAASRLGRPATLVAALAAVASLDFFFVPPLYTFAVSDARYVLTFAMLFVVGLVVSGLQQRVRAQADAARERERRTAALYEMTRELAGRTSADAIAASAVRHVRELFDAAPSSFGGAPGAGHTPPNAVLVRARPDGVDVLAGPSLDLRDEAVAKWVCEHGQSAGSGTDTLPGGPYRFLPLVGRHGVLGGLGLSLGERRLGASQEELLHIVAANVAVALERAWLAEASEAARLVLETERTRTGLLSSVSHDLRTPLASITGAASAALASEKLTEADRHALLETIRDEGDRLGRLITGLHQLTRLEAVPVAKKEWVPIDEVVASAVDRLRDQVADREVVVRVPDELLQVPMDPVLVDQLLFNLLDNAVKYAPGPIEVEARREGDEARVVVMDRGPGLPADAGDQVFERFWRAPDGKRAEGSGLGLAIAAAIARVHGGRVWAANRAGGGAVFGFALPIDGVPPTEPP